MCYSTELQLSEGFTHVRKRVDWERWVLSTSTVLGRSTPAGETSTGETAASGDLAQARGLLALTSEPASLQNFFVFSVA